MDQRHERDGADRRARDGWGAKGVEAAHETRRARDNALLARQLHQADKGGEGAGSDQQDRAQVISVVGVQGAVEQHPPQTERAGDDKARKQRRAPCDDAREQGANDAIAEQSRHQKQQQRARKYPRLEKFGGRP